MCQRKPGRRCPSHAQAALAAAERRVATATERAEAAAAPGSGLPPSKVQRRMAALARANENLAHARMEADATVTGRDALLRELARMDVKGAKRARLSARFERADALIAARARQRDLMPERGDAAGEERAYSMLAEARHEYATVEALDRTTPDDAPERQAVEARKAVLGERVFALDVQHRLVTSGGAVDAEHVTPEEQTAARKAGPVVLRSLAVLSHQRAAAADGGHDQRLVDAVDEAGAAFAARHLPPPQTPTVERAARPAATARAPRRASGRRSLGAAQAQALLRQSLMGRRTQIVPGKQQGDPIGLLPDPV